MFFGIWTRLIYLIRRKVVKPTYNYKTNRLRLSWHCNMLPWGRCLNTSYSQMMSWCLFSPITFAEVFDSVDPRPTQTYLLSWVTNEFECFKTEYRNQYFKIWDTLKSGHDHYISTPEIQFLSFKFWVLYCVLVIGKPWKSHWKGLSWCIEVGSLVVNYIYRSHLELKWNYAPYSDLCVCISEIIMLSCMAMTDTSKILKWNHRYSIWFEKPLTTSPLHSFSYYF